MAKKNSMGYYAALLRKQGQRRIERLQQTIRDSSVTKSTRQWAREQIREIRSAMQGTRMYSTNGKRYKTKTLKYIGQQMARLTHAISGVKATYTAKNDPFERSFWMTQQQLNMASADKPSVYTQTEAKLLYRVTQKIWQKEGVSIQDRNQEILEYYNSIRRQNNLSMITFDDLVQYIIKANERFKDIQEINPEEDMDDAEKEKFNQAQKSDNSDAPVGSPPGIGQSVVNAIEDALEDLFILPDPLKI